MADPCEEGRQRVAVGFEVHGSLVGTNLVGGQSIWICELFYWFAMVEGGQAALQSIPNGKTRSGMPSCTRRVENERIPVRWWIK